MVNWIQKIECSYCSHKFVSDTIEATIYLYGIILLEGENDGFIGTTCPKCMKTILVNVDRKNLNEAIFWLHGPNVSTRSHCFEPLGYFSPYPRYVIPDVTAQWFRQPSGVPEEIEGSDRVKFDLSIMRYEEAENISPGEYYRSYIYELADVSGTFLEVWWFTKTAIAIAMQHENEREIRVFPRYIHKFKLLEKVDYFSWKYRLKEEFLNFSLKNAQKARGSIQDLGIEPESLEEPPSNPELIKSLIYCQLKTIEKDSWVHASFQDILTAETPFYSHHINITDTLDRFLECREETLNAGSQSVFITNENLIKIREFFEKGESNEFLREKYLKFIKKYIEIHQKSYFSPFEIWALRDEYLNYYLEYIREQESKLIPQLNEGITEDEKIVSHALELLPKRNKKEAKRCVYLAWFFKTKYSEISPKINPSEVAKTKELCRACEHFDKGTRRDWIAPLWKNDNLKGGKPPKDRQAFFLDTNDLKMFGRTQWLIKMFGHTILECEAIVESLRNEK